VASRPVSAPPASGRPPRAARLGPPAWGRTSGAEEAYAFDSGAVMQNRIMATVSRRRCPPGRRATARHAVEASRRRPGATLSTRP